MKFNQLSVAWIVIALTTLCSGVSAHGSAWWHNLSQTSRNNYILDRACEELGDNTGLSCKEWVRDVVKDASDQSVIIPPTKPNKYQWYSHPYVYGMPQPSPVTWAQPGSIIQMKWTMPNGTSLPHTAIVLSHTGSGMWWIDCNWNFDTKVIVHFISYSLFYERVGSYYTIYYIE